MTGAGSAGRGFYRYPDEVHLTSTCASLFVAAGSWPEATRLYASAVAVHPETGGLWRSLGLALREMGDLESSVEALQRAAHLSARLCLYPLRSRTAFWANLGRGTEATRAYR